MAEDLIVEETTAQDDEATPAVVVDEMLVLEVLARSIDAAIQARKIGTTPYHVLIVPEMGMPEHSTFQTAIEAAAFLKARRQANVWFIVFRGTLCEFDGACTGINTPDGYFALDESSRATPSFLGCLQRTPPSSPSSPPPSSSENDPDDDDEEENEFDDDDEDRDEDDGDEGDD